MRCCINSSKLRHSFHAASWTPIAADLSQKVSSSRARTSQQANPASTGQNMDDT